MFDESFYPTPRSVAYRMLSKISRDAVHFLEPSAGKGDLAQAIRERGGRNVKVDCIERSPELVSVLLGKDFPVVGFDWLDYSGVSYYDAICINPPYAEGPAHLLKAWDFLYAGEIVCLLNEESIKNPYTAERQRLVKLIEQHGNVEYLEDCFRSAERTTDVKVAMVYLKKECKDDLIDLWASTTEEKPIDDELGGDRNMLAIRDQLGNMQHYYDMANQEMLKAFQHIRKARLYMDANGVRADSDYEKIVSLALVNLNNAKAEYVRKHRRDAWMNVFTKMEFRKWLDKKQTDEFVRDIERNGNVPFTKENIKGTLQNVFLQRRMLFEKSVANVFDALTSYFKGNTNHTEGWKTNDSYKVNQKLVFPWGCSYSYGGFNLYSRSNEIDVYNDLDRVIAVLAGDDFGEIVTVGSALRDEFHRLGSMNPKGPFSAIESRYFEIRYFKKGTVHLKFKDVTLWEKFNITASAGKKWIGENTRNAA